MNLDKLLNEQDQPDGLSKLNKLAGQDQLDELVELDTLQNRKIILVNNKNYITLMSQIKQEFFFDEYLFI